MTQNIAQNNLAQSNLAQGGLAQGGLPQRYLAHDDAALAQDYKVNVGLAELSLPASSFSAAFLNLIPSSPSS